MRPLIVDRCQPYIDGQAISEQQMLRYEVERGRIALALLKRKLGAERLQELLADETDETEREIEARGSPEGKFVLALTEVRVRGGTAEEFLAFFQHLVRTHDYERLDAGNPEHYVVAPTADGRLDVIENVGAWKLPQRFFVKLGEGAEAAPNPADVDPSYPILMAGRARTQKGEEVYRVLHQFGNTEDGFRAKLGIYFSAKAPPEQVQGHKWHLACEFTNWVNMYLAEQVPQ